MKLGTEVFKEKLSSEEFHENRLSERSTLLKGVNETLAVFSAFVLPFGCYSKCPQTVVG